MSNDNSSKPIQPLDYTEATDRNERDLGRDESEKITDLELDRLVANKNQTRLEYDDLGFFEINKDNLDEEELKQIESFISKIKENEDINSLITSIKNYGLQQPIGVYKYGINPLRYEVIFGHRRTLAYKILAHEEKMRLKKEGKPLQENKYKKIKAIVYDRKSFVSKGFEALDGSFMLNVVENLYRKDLNLIEKGILYEELAKKVKKEEIEEEKKRLEQTAATANARKKTEHSIALEKVAIFLGISPTEVSNAVRIKNGLHPEIIKQIIDSKLSSKEKIKIDIFILQELTKLRGYIEQLELWNYYQKNTVNREKMRMKVIETKSLLGLSLRSDEKDTIETGRLNFKKGSSEIKFVKDNQGFKIRNKAIAELTEKDNQLLETKIKKAISEFFKEKKKILFDEMMGNDSTEE